MANINLTKVVNNSIHNVMYASIDVCEHSLQTPIAKQNPKLLKPSFYEGFISLLIEIYNNQV